MHPEQTSLHHHFAGELHAGRTNVHAMEAVLPEGANPAVKVSARRPEEQSPNPREPRVTDMRVKKRHDIALDTAMETIAHY
jgi:hypothetical protein